jgi:ankyrin repeat protein
MKLATVCRVLGKIWLGLGGTAIMVGSVATWYFHGWRAYQDLMSPYNVYNVIAVIITLSPGLLLVMAADELEQGRRKAALTKVALVPVALLFASGLFAVAWSGHTARSVGAAERRAQRYSAISEGRLEDLKRLTEGSLRAEAEADVPPLLMYALLKQQEAIARYLVEQGADVNVIVDGITPLHLAIMRKYVDLARVMISKGANINTRPAGARGGGGSPFLLAVSLGTYSEDEILALFPTTGPRPDVSVVDAHGRTALVWSIVNHYERVAIWLLDLGANVNARDDQGMTPLQHSVYRGTVAITRDLVRRRAQIDVTDENGATPLMQALFFFRQSPTTDYLDTARVLIEGGADLNAKSQGGHTPLMFAAAVNQDRLVEAMIQRGANVNAENEAGQTALMVAAAHGYVRVVNVLLARGASVTSRTKDGKTALAIAKEGGHKDIEQILRRKGATD